ncbi:MAG TPA: DMT family transporter [Bacteroidales bacterium]|jgi:drug/metabolite transporter (DMT)-like permease|nr:DMT family transporter [Bacteroidales bacterium]
MIAEHYGELAALLVAVFWAVTALSFESASRKVGSLPVNIIRLVIGLIFLSVLNLFIRGLALPTDATSHNWIWLSVSGLIGFVIGDFFLLKSLTIIGSWFAMLIMTLAPPMAAVFGWIILDEHLNALAIGGIVITMSGIIIAMFRRDVESRKFTTSKPMTGLFYAFGGALGQALGIVFSKYGMGDYNPFAATQIRIIMGIIGLVVIITVLRKWNSVVTALNQRKAMSRITIGSFFGPFLGVSFSLISIRLTSTGIASTIMALVPIFIIPPSIWYFKHRITLREIIGTIVSLSGVALFFL